MIKQVRETLDDAIKSQVSIDVQTTNTHYTPSILEPWCRTTLIPSETINLTLGTSPCVDVNGVYQVDIFVPAGSDADEINTLTETLVKYFYANRRLPINTSDEFVQITTIWETVATTNSDWYNAGFSLRYSNITKLN